MSYQEVVERVAEASLRSGRSPDEVTVVAVSKTMSPESIMSVYQQGHRDFGENRAQEMESKATELPPDIRWHFVGALQSNKAKLIRPMTHLLHSMDRKSLADAWLKGPGLPPPVLVQVNVAEEPQKSGVPPGQTGAMVSRLLELGLDVRGLMAIPPIPEDAKESRPHFVILRRLRDEIAATSPGVVELSMGMTDDFEVAIEEGASIIRVGRAIFGPRK